MSKKIIVLFLLLISQNIWAFPTAKLTVKVIDETGTPVEDAKVGIGFSLPKGQGQGAGSDIKGVRGITDGEGLFTAKGESEPYVGFGVKKEGYYRGSGKFNNFTGTSGIMGFRKYKPWNPTIEVVLKRKVNPIAMYAFKNKSLGRGKKPEMPYLSRFVGFDLMANDWIVPHGLGTHRDFLFKVDVKRAVSNRDYDVTLTLQFPNEGDGLIEYTPDLSKGKSTLRLPHHAPTTGYQPELVQRYESKPGVLRYPKSANPDYDTNYLFRIRTQLDKDGNAISGLYGKIYGEIRAYNYTLRRKEYKPFVAFDYYLNPNDTNIEFDPKKNLFKNLKRQQEVKDP